MKRKVIVNFFVVVLVLIIITSIFLMYKNNYTKEVKLDTVKLKESVSNSFALMLEQSNGTYEETIDTEWPSEGYTFNKYMSGCIDSNGNTIENTLTYKNGTIKLKTKHNTYCYIYFDIDRPATDELLATAPEEQLWDSTLEDDGYRYVGTNPDNYICFGTTSQEECMNDTNKYMYRIIGIFEDAEGKQHLKLIKKEALNTTYAWHSENVDVSWKESDLYNGINGNYFATNPEYSYMQDSAWNNLIKIWNYTAANTLTYINVVSTGKYGASYALLTTKEVYLHEMNRTEKTLCSSTIDSDCKVGEWETLNSKIGLMYASDYLLSLGSSVLEYKSYDNRTILKTGWMHIFNNSNNYISAYEWTMSRYDSVDDWDAWAIMSDGSLGGYGITAGFSARPVFYLKSDTKLDKGLGTIEDPYTIQTSLNLREYCEEYNNINECIKNEENNIEEVSELWNSTLEDDGIRYVGTNPNNYICFGTTNPNECTGDTDKYMYRIIGIFEDGEGKQHLKLIKKESLNTAYAWHSDYLNDTDWDESDLYKGINGSYFLTNTNYSYMQNNTWLNKIIDWNYTAANTKTTTYLDSQNVLMGIYYSTFNTVFTIYLHEMNRAGKSSQTCYNENSIVDCNIGEWKTVSSKISLMYVSDYLLSLGNASLNYNAFDNRDNLKNGWIHLNNNDVNSISQFDWTSSRRGAYSDGWYRTWRIEPDGFIGAPLVNNIFSVRPVFHLTENTKITSGKGSITEPFIIS